MASEKERYTKWVRLWLLGFGANRYKNVKREILKCSLWCWVRAEGSWYDYN